MSKELLKKWLEALIIGKECAIDSLNEAERMYSANFRPHNIESAKKDLQQINAAIDEIEAELAKPDPVSHEPPCGWEKLNSLFIEKASYLMTGVDWDNQQCDFEALAQLINYGKTALRQCREDRCPRHMQQLTDNEIKTIRYGLNDDGNFSSVVFARIIEQALIEKNK
jgi:hypothetical protein